MIDSHHLRQFCEKDMTHSGSRGNYQLELELELVHQCQSHRNESIM